MSKKRRIGIDLGGTNITFIDLSSAEAIHRQWRISTPATVEAITEALLQNIDSAVLSENDEEVSGIGIALAGQIDAAGQSVVFSPNLPYKEPYPIGEILKNRTGLKVTVENDANSAAVGEKVFGAAQKMNNFITLTLGTGIGSGFYVNGRLMRGASGGGGEAGHMVIDPSGPLCGCGNTGCLEAFASGTAIANFAQAKYGYTVTAKEVCAQADEGDDHAIEILQSAGSRLGDGLVSLINIFNPEAIFFTGSLASAEKYYLETAIAKARRLSFGTLADGVRMEVSELKDTIGVMGSAALTDLY